MSSAESASAGRILVVDDETAICRVVTRTLERNGFTAASVSRVGDLEQALKSATFDVILLDRSMGPGDGSSLLPVLREFAPDAKILFFTGEFVDPSEVATVDGVVQKPINGKDLADTLRRIL
jgi:DNA-binding response OmpR family regulator